jgi:hypothetical protein
VIEPAFWIVIDTTAFSRIKIEIGNGTMVVGTVRVERISTRACGFEDTHRCLRGLKTLSSVESDNGAASTRQLTGGLVAVLTVHYGFRLW